MNAVPHELLARRRLQMASVSVLARIIRRAASTPSGSSFKASSAALRCVPLSANMGPVLGGYWGVFAEDNGGSGKSTLS